MTHTAGLGHWPDYAAIDPAQSIDDDDFVAAVRARPASHRAPGSALLQQSWLRAAGPCDRASQRTDLCKIRDREHLRPLEMVDTFVGNGNDRDAVARGYRGADELPSWELDCASKGAGDIWTTARDLDRWDRALLSDALLPIASRD